MVDRGADRVVPHRDAPDDSRHVHEDQVALVVDGHARGRAQLVQVDPELLLVRLEVRAQGAPGLCAQLLVVPWRGALRRQVVSPARSRHQRLLEDQRAPPTDARVVEPRLLGNAELRELRPKPCGHGRIQVLEGLRGFGHVEIRVSESLLSDGWRATWPIADAADTRHANRVSQGLHALERFMTLLNC